MSFADNLKTLPSITHLKALHLVDANGNEVATIPNQPGKAGSVAVYNALATKLTGGEIKKEWAAR